MSEGFGTGGGVVLGVTVGVLLIRTDFYPAPAPFYNPPTPKVHHPSTHHPFSETQTCELWR